MNLRRNALAAIPAICAALCAAALPAAAVPNARPTRESDATLVVFNNLDAASIDLAAYYAKRRAIPLDHIVGLDCPLTEEITRAQYDQTIAQPLRKIFSDRGWWVAPPDGGPVTGNVIRFVALIRGIPLKIAGTPNYPGDTPMANKQLDNNAAAVDSELSTLGVRTPHITGPLNNLYYRSFSPFMDSGPAALMLVCRLDGPSEETVKYMIDSSLQAERTGLEGFAYIDLRGITTGPLAIGDQWLATAAVGLRRYGFPLIWDNAPEVIPEDFPMDHAAFYLGWYDAAVKGPMARDDFRFVPGAVAVHIHSFSASTVRATNQFWVGPLLAHGAAATLGNVYEPYLALTSNLDVLADRLRNGFTFAESAYASLPVVSWMTTVVGDPLYRPMREMDEPPDYDALPHGREYAAYRRGAHIWFEQGRAEGEKRLRASAESLRSGIVWEGLGLLEWSIPDNTAALDSFRHAQQSYGQTEDAMRTVLHQVEILNSQGKKPEARALAAKGLAQYKDFHGAALLRVVIGLPPATRAP